MPVFNAGAYLRASIESVLAQTFGAFELIVVDDASSDGSSDVLASYRDRRLRVIRHERNLGLTATLNRGLRESGSDLIARQDADDVSTPTRLARQVEFLDRHPDVALVGTQAHLIDAGGRPFARAERGREHQTLRWELLFDNPFLHTSVVFRRDALEALGGFDETFSYCQDYDAWSRLAAVRRLANLGEPLVLSRVHASSMTATMQARRREENRRILIRNEGALLGRAPAAEEVELILASRTPATLDPKCLPALLALLDRLLAHAADAGIDTDRPDFRRALARQYAALLATQRWHLRSALRIFFNGFRRSPLARTLAAAVADHLFASRRLRLPPVGQTPSPPV
jgi:glycosyltransferase involved in cell wall biosynthesis